MKADEPVSFRAARIFVATESHKLAALYEEIAKVEGCRFYEAASVATADPVDGVHLDASNTRAIGAALAPVVSELILP